MYPQFDDTNKDFFFLYGKSAFNTNSFAVKFPRVLFPKTFVLSSQPTHTHETHAPDNSLRHCLCPVNPQQSPIVFMCPPPIWCVPQTMNMIVHQRRNPNHNHNHHHLLLLHQLQQLAKAPPSLTIHLKCLAKKIITILLPLTTLVVP